MFAYVDIFGVLAFVVSSVTLVFVVLIHRRLGQQSRREHMLRLARDLAATPAADSGAQPDGDERRIAAACEIAALWESGQLSRADLQPFLPGIGAVLQLPAVAAEIASPKDRDAPASRPARAPLARLAKYHFAGTA